LLEEEEEKEKQITRSKVSDDTRVNTTIAWLSTLTTLKGTEKSEDSSEEERRSEQNILYSRIKKGERAK